MSMPGIWSRYRAIQLAIDRCPASPYASDDFKKFGCSREPYRKALLRANIQLNAGDTCSVLVFDADHEFNQSSGEPHLGACWAWERHNLPPPSWIAIDRHNGHAHLAYVLDQPVRRMSEKTRKPVWLLGVVRRAMTKALGADPAYQNFLTKNPLHRDWHVIPFDRTYDLNELCEWIPQRFIDEAKRSSGAIDHSDVAYSSSQPWAFSVCSPILYANWPTVVREAKANGRSSTLEQLCREKITDPSTGELSLKEEHFQKLLRDLIRWGLANYDENKRRKLLRELQSRRGKKSARIRRERTGLKVTQVVEQLRAAGQPVTMQAVANLVGRDRSVISRCYRHLLE